MTPIAGPAIWLRRLSSEIWASVRASDILSVVICKILKRKDREILSEGEIFSENKDIDKIFCRLVVAWNRYEGVSNLRCGLVLAVDLCNVVPMYWASPPIYISIQ